MRFNRMPEYVGTFSVSYDDLRNFPQVYRCSAEFVKTLGHKPLSAAVDQALKQLTQKWKFISIDTRLSMLMEGMYPCIPGWHVDDFWRPEGKKTDLLTVPEAEHIGLNLGTCSNTIFLKHPITIEIPTPAELEVLDTNVHTIIHKEVERKEIASFPLQEREFWRFFPTTIHRGSAATENGWRYFFRLSGSNHREPLNQLRTQTQVYVADMSKGW